ncbi:cell division control protein, partial [Tulasnella sp. 425]
TTAVDEIRPPPYGGFDSITRQIKYKPLKRGFQFNVAVVRRPNQQRRLLEYDYQDQHSAFLRKELTAMCDKHIQDTRIHCCLFFINPIGLSLRSIDIIADSLTLEEREVFKNNIRAEMQYNNTRLYPFDTDENDPEKLALNETIPSLGSEHDVLVDGKPVRGRKNKWGVINVEDETHCEFVHFRNFLRRTHLQHLIETTAQIHYEAFRSKQLLALKDASARPAQGSA